ncbi:MAG TPA: hypothetical protein VFR54_01530, partial [Xanthobacteraceae bacterium]|nr:hypothetical protein [Xanthobacteraceae bacterium]
MSLAPLLNAAPATQLHAFAAMAAFGLGAVQLAALKGTIHLLSIFTLATLPLAIVHARRHRVERHRNAMISIFIGALVIAGLFT